MDPIMVMMMVMVGVVVICFVGLTIPLFWMYKDPVDPVEVVKEPVPDKELKAISVKDAIAGLREIAGDLE